MHLCWKCLETVDDDTEAQYLGLSMEALREIRMPQRKFRNYQKRMRGNKYVKFPKNSF